MNEVREVIQRFQTAYSHGAASRSTRLSKRYIFSIIKGIRARVLSQEAKKNQMISSWAYQTIPCVDLEVVPLNQCPCTPQTGCMILRSTTKLPEIIALKNKHLCIITTNEGTLRLTESTFSEVKFNKGNKYTPSAICFFFTGDGYLYVSATLKLETLRVEAVFADFVKAYQYPSACREEDISCISPLNFLFPYEEDLIPSLIELGLPEVQVFANGREDKFNNSSEDGFTATKG